MWEIQKEGQSYEYLLEILLESRKREYNRLLICFGKTIGRDVLKSVHTTETAPKSIDNQAVLPKNG